MVMGSLEEDHNHTAAGGSHHKLQSEADRSLAVAHTLAAAAARNQAAGTLRSQGQEGSLHSLQAVGHSSLDQVEPEGGRNSDASKDHWPSHH